jgi:hypothetical protein
VSIFARVEAACADVVERAFALAFPSALEPVQIARKLVAVFESGAAPGGRGGRRFAVRLSPADFARLEPGRAYLEAQWSAMLARLAERSGRPQRPPEVRAELDPSVANGTVAIGVEVLPEPARLALRVRRGLPAEVCVPLEGTVVVGRDSACDLALFDGRVSRRHLEIAQDGADLRLRDLGSSNGTELNGRRVESAPLGLGDVIAIGDCELGVEAAAES